MDNLHRNAEGYSDPTAYGGMKAAMREEREVQNKLNKLVTCLKLIIDLAGFEMTARIQLKHRKSGREFK